MQELKMNGPLKRLAIQCLDLTSLNDTDTEDDIRSLCQQAITPLGNVAAICLAPEFVDFAKRTLVDPSIEIATVANFPSGNDTPAQVLACVKTALFDGATEIDVVLPYQAYANGDTETAIALIADVKKLCGKITLKVILESGALTPAQIAGASKDCLIAGADFLKTSTGKIAQGASLAAAKIMLTALKEYGATNARTVGFKASGGVRTPAEAADYIQLARKIMGEDWVSAKTFRLGASSLLKALLD
jgi:deoxyribose-phosphate aldolase